MIRISRESPNRRAIGRDPGGATRVAVAALGVLLATAAAGPAQAQDLVHRFVDPSFGGNPFYSDHLLATAAISRPSAPTTPSTTQTQEELIAQQLRAQLLSKLSGNILDSINNAKVGDSGTFNFGNQTVDFTKTATATTITFTNTSTGEKNTVVIPASGSSSSSVTGTGTTATTTTGATASPLAAARAAAAASSTNIAVTGSLTGVSSTGVASPSAEQVLSASLGGSAGSGSALPPF